MLNVNNRKKSFKKPEKKSCVCVCICQVCSKVFLSIFILKEVLFGKWLLFHFTNKTENEKNTYGFRLLIKKISFSGFFLLLLFVVWDRLNGSRILFYSITLCYQTILTVWCLCVFFLDSFSLAITLIWWWLYPMWITHTHEFHFLSLSGSLFSSPLLLFWSFDCVLLFIFLSVGYFFPFS